MLDDLKPFSMKREDVLKTLTSVGKTKMVSLQDGYDCKMFRVNIIADTCVLNNKKIVNLRAQKNIITTKSLQSDSVYIDYYWSSC